MLELLRSSGQAGRLSLPKQSVGDTKARLTNHVVVQRMEM
jgi:hypothetical protein